MDRRLLPRSLGLLKDQSTASIPERSGRRHSLAKTQISQVVPGIEIDDGSVSATETELLEDE
jgi:hypothetical protein